MNPLTHLRDVWKFSKADRAFIAELRSSLADGVLTDDECYWLQERHSQLGASGAWQEIAGELFLTAVRGADKDGEISAEAEQQLTRISEYLRVDASHSTKAFNLMNELVALRNGRLARTQTLHQLEFGTVTAPPIPNLVMRRGETVLWSIGGTLYETKVVSRRYEGGSRGVSLRIVKGVSVRVGAQRGQLVTEEGNVPVSSGLFVVTNQRLIFQGDAKSVSDSLDKILDINPSPNSLRYSTSSRSKPRWVQFNRPDGEMCCAALNRAMREFHE